MASMGPPRRPTRLEELPHCPFLTLKVDLRNRISEQHHSQAPFLRPVSTPHTNRRALSTVHESPKIEAPQQQSLNKNIAKQTAKSHITSAGSAALTTNVAYSTSKQTQVTAEHGTPKMSNNFQDVGGVGTALKDVVNDLFLIQSQVHEFHSDHQQNLNSKIDDLVESLANVQGLTSKEESPNNPIHDVLIAPDIIDYVDDGRNPDIYTRDFVELVQRGNAVLNGRLKAFRDFSAILASKIKTSVPELNDEVDMIMNKAGIQMEAEPGYKQANGST